MWMSGRQSWQTTAEHTTWYLTAPHLLAPDLRPAAFQSPSFIEGGGGEGRGHLLFVCVSLNNVTCYLQSKVSIKSLP